jgi:hypothetical protein
MKNLTTLIAVSLIMTGNLHASGNMNKSDEEVKQKMEEAAQDTKRGTKEVGRDAKEAACPIVNGKVDCAFQKGKHNIQRGADKVEDAID